MERPMADITFTQFLRPFGRPTPVSINRPDDISSKAVEIRERGFRFECEELWTGEVSLTISNDDGDHDIEVVPNGPDVPAAVDRMISRFHVALHQQVPA
jgi:hypothetical protein